MASRTREAPIQLARAAGRDSNTGPRDVGSDPQSIKLLVDHLDTRSPARCPLLLVLQDRDVLLKLVINMPFRFLHGRP